MKKPLSKKKIEQIKSLVLSQGNKLTNKEMSKKLRVEIMPFAGVIAGMKANGSLKNGFLRTEVNKNKTSKKMVRTLKAVLVKNTPVTSLKEVNVIFPKIASIPSASLSRELIQGIELHNETLIKRARFYSTNEFEKSLGKIIKSKISIDSKNKLNVLTNVLDNSKCKYIEII